MWANHCWRGAHVTARPQTAGCWQFFSVAGPHRVYPWEAVKLQYSTPAFLQSTHKVNSKHKARTRAYSRGCTLSNWHAHTSPSTCLSTGLLVSASMFSLPLCLFFPFCLCSMWHKVDRHVCCACGLLLLEVHSLSLPSLQPPKVRHWLLCDAAKGIISLHKRTTTSPESLGSQFQSPEGTYGKDLCGC